MPRPTSVGFKSFGRIVADFDFAVQRLENENPTADGLLNGRTGPITVKLAWPLAVALSRFRRMRGRGSIVFGYGIRGQNDRL
ncbi:MAG: hypothetical protein ACXW02_05985 [Halobacteriota archaeon]